MKLEHGVPKSLEKAPNFTILALNQHDSKNRLFLFFLFRRFPFWRFHPGLPDRLAWAFCGSRLALGAGASREELRRSDAQFLSFHANAYARAAQGFFCGVSPDGYQVGFFDPETRMSHMLSELTVIGQE
jgi:hypothetical protein